MSDKTLLEMSEILWNSQEQCDEDGCMVAVSRQALDEIMPMIREAALSAHGLPVVDEAMIERAEAAWFAEPRTGTLTGAIHRMLTAALSGDGK